MNQPSLEALMKKVDSKYSLVVVAAKRARQLTEKEKNKDEENPVKPVTKALYEIAEGLLTYERPKGGIK
ncbi:MAG: DNA-directed RNA polymerase subunit omega [Clostridia bacterium]|nr:DNA-directed RNA polymerase subunit omega [Clostridia bacterium]